jgi:coenzyme F420-reducing hydrogenase gamma subunit
MTVKIIQEGVTTYHATCHECGCKFSYNREDVHHNYLRGIDCIGCPSCGASCQHNGFWAQHNPYRKPYSLLFSPSGHYKSDWRS